MSQLTTPLHIFDLPPEILEVIFVHSTNALDRTIAVHTCRILHDIVRGNTNNTQLLLNYHDICLAAAKCGYFNIYNWTSPRFQAGITDVANAAISGGQLKFLRKLEATYYYRPDPAACTLAVRHNHIEILKWLLNYVNYKNIYDNAIKYGRLDILQWAAVRGIKGLSYHHCHLAAFNGQLEIVQWFYHTKRFTFEAMMCTMAARGNKLEILKWLRSVGCPWDASVHRIVPSGSNAETVQWAIDNGCP